MTVADRIESVRNWLAFFLVGAFVGALLAFTWKNMPEQNKDILTYMVGQLSGMATLALGYFFTKGAGQDQADAAKTENTAKMAEAIKATAAVGKQSADVILEPGETAQAGEN